MNKSSVSSGGNSSSFRASDDDAVTALDYADYVFVPLLFTLGLVGNSLTLRVMASKAYRRLPVSKLLIALSLSDMLVNVLSPFNKPFVRRLLGADPRALSSGVCKLYFWAYRFSRLTSSWMVVVVCLERFVAVWLSTRARRINTTRHAYAAIGVVYVGFATYVGYVCSWSDAVVGGVCIINSRRPGLERRTRVFLAIGLVMYSLLPSVVLIVLTALLVYKIVNTNRKRSSQVRASDAGPAASTSKVGRTSKINLMLLSVVVAFIVLVTPNALAHLVSFVKKKNIFEAEDSVSIFLRGTSQVTEQLNHSINFLLYVFSSKRFRDGVIVIFKPAKSNQLISMNSTVNNASTAQSR